MVRLVAGILFAFALAASPVYAIDPPATPAPTDDYLGIDGSFLALQPPLDTVDNYGPSGDNYTIIFAEVIDPTTSAKGPDFFELPYNPLSLPEIDFTNSAGDSLSLHNVGFMLSSTEIPLDYLSQNYSGSGLPSGFSPISGFPDGTIVPADGSTATEALPEPSSVWLMALAGAFLGALGLRSCRLV